MNNITIMIAVIVFFAIIMLTHKSRQSNFNFNNIDVTAVPRNVTYLEPQGVTQTLAQPDNACVSCKNQEAPTYLCGNKEMSAREYANDIIAGGGFNCKEQRCKSGCDYDIAMPIYEMYH